VYPPLQKLFSPGALARSALIAAAYALLVVFFAPLSYGPVQVRIAEALTLLPWLWVEAVPGLFLGCLIANLFGGFGLVDVIFGSSATLIAAVMTRLMPNKVLAALPPRGGECPRGRGVSFIPDGGVLSLRRHVCRRRTGRRLLCPWPAPSCGPRAALPGRESRFERWRRLLLSDMRPLKSTANVGPMP